MPLLMGCLAAAEWGRDPALRADTAALRRPCLRATALRGLRRVAAARRGLGTWGCGPTTSPAASAAARCCSACRARVIPGCLALLVAATSTWRKYFAREVSLVRSSTASSSSHSPASSVMRQVVAILYARHMLWHARTPLDSLRTTFHHLYSALAVTSSVCCSTAMAAAFRATAVRIRCSAKRALKTTIT